MNIIEALTLAKEENKKVRPVCWAESFPGHWVDYRAELQGLFVEHGDMEEMVHALRLEHESELLGPWEVVE